MKNGNLFRALFCFIFLSSLLIPASPARAASSVSVEIPLEALNADKPVQIKGLVSSVTLDLSIPVRYQAAEETWLDLGILPSPLLDGQRSSLTITLNDHQVSSLHLADLTGGRQKVNVLPSFFKSGSNALTLTGMLYLTTDQADSCRNWNDPSRWLELSTDSLLHLAMSPSKAGLDLGSFPEAFIQPVESYLAGAQATRTLFVLPDAPERDDYSALVALSYILGKSAPSSLGWLPEVISQSQFSAEKAAHDHLVFINVLPHELSLQADAGKDALSLKPSPWNNQKAALIIIDHDRQDGATPAVAFSDPVRRVFLHGELAYVDPLPAADPPQFKNERSFADLGYTDRTVRGIGEGSLIYRFDVPYTIEADAATLTLALTHVPDLASDRSSITVYINGYSIAGIVPNNRSAATTPIQIGIPVRRLRPGENFLRITFDMKVDYSSCEKSPDTIWALVHNSSTLAFRTHPRIHQPTLDDFPMPFSDNPSTTFVLPDQPDSRALISAARMAYLLGQPAIYANRPPAAVTASQFDPKTASPNVILSGLLPQNAIIHQVNSLLPQPLSQDGNNLAKGYGVYIPDTTKEAGIGLIQILPSPWTKGGALLVVTGIDEEGLAWAWDGLLNSSRWEEIRGNLVFAGAGQRSQAQDTSAELVYQTTANVSPIPFIGPLLQNIQPGNLIPAVVSIAASLLLVLLVLVILQFSERRR